jgi:hypothetical protein
MATLFVFYSFASISAISNHKRNYKIAFFFSFFLFLLSSLCLLLPARDEEGGQSAPPPQRKRLPSLLGPSAAQPQRSHSACPPP